MSEKPGDPAGETGEMFGGAIEAQRRGVAMAQDWAAGVISQYNAQAESYRALTDAVRSSLEALDATLKSQEQTNRALRESLDAYRTLIENAGTSQERNLGMAQGYFESVVEALRGQLASSRALLAEPALRQQELFQNATKEWMDAYLRLLQSPFGPQGASRGTPGEAPREAE